MFSQFFLKQETKTQTTHNPHKIPKDANLKDCMNMQRYYLKKPAILNKYYETNLIQIVDRITQTADQDEQLKFEKALNQKRSKQNNKNLQPTSHKQEQLLLQNVTLAYHHESDRLNQDLEINQYKFLNLLGRGAHSVVRQAKSKENKNEIYAVKILWFEKIRKKYFIKPNDLISMVSNEIILLKKLKSQNIIGFKDAIYLKQKERMFVILQHCSKGPMSKIVNNNLTMENDQWWELVRKYFREFVNGIHSMHKQNVIHRDIKPDNLLVNKDDVLKIIDFNVSNYTDQNGMIKVTNKFIGTKGYAAPQLILDVGDGKLFDGKKIDVWAMGITLLEILQRKHPYPVKTLPQLIQVLREYGKQQQQQQKAGSQQQRTKEQAVLIRINSEYPKALQDLLRKMLRFENKDRILTDQILESQWLKK